ncbi:hypothetical protein PVAP13_2KG002416 [Panicum virgatum]|uniref:F-box domain-containing protein n=1 Tax=Panicum virgatum TaxID=38727 RepID=A0A8T0VYP5_PANVG|nr:hypothetical protein PVAP13_2KG002416 [Panicum virgatum]
MASAPALLDDLTEEIFLRIHPADAATLVRAALVCRRWCRLIAAPGFRRRFREFHRAPHMLGFSCNIDSGSFYSLPSTVARFVRTCSCLKRVDMESSRVIDTRHGRVLLVWESDRGNKYLFVWDPIGKEEHKLPWIFWYPDSWNAAVFCTAAGCDHLDCHGKPFAVFFVATSHTGIFNFVYSSETGSWSDASDPFAQQTDDALVLEPSALVGNELYFLLQTKTQILKCNISTREMHMIHLPPSACFSERRIVLMATDDRRLGFATVSGSNLCLWSREVASDKDAGWAQKRAIDLKTLLPDGALVMPPDVAGFAEGIGFIFMETNYGHFRIDLKSSYVKKLRTVNGVSIIFPYMSFHTPALGAAAASTVDMRSVWQAGS